MAGTFRVTLSSRKGGAGKTSVTVCLARDLVAQGARVLVVDLDPQAVGASMRLGADIASPLKYTALDLVLGSKERLFEPQSIIKDKLDVIAGNQADLASLETELVLLHHERKLTIGPNPRRGVLDARLAGVEIGYDFVLVDTPTGLGEITTNALEAAHLVLSPIDMECSDCVESVADLMAHMAELSRPVPVYFVGNKWKQQETQSRAALARAFLLCGGRFLRDAMLPKCTAVPQALTEHRDIAVSSAASVMFRENMRKLGKLVMDCRAGKPGGGGGGANDDGEQWEAGSFDGKRAHGAS